MRRWGILRSAAALLLFVVLAAAVAALSADVRERFYSFAKHDDEDFAPFEIADGLYYVGTSDIAVYALDTPDGVILIDAGYGWNTARVLANLRAVHLDPANVRVLLNSHAHFDHAAGFAALRAAMPDAKLYANPIDTAVLGGGGRSDFHGLMTYPRVEVDRELRDGEPVVFGDRRLTPHFTPGHTQGCTSWTFELQIDGAPRNVLLICSLTMLPDWMYDESRYPKQQRIADFERSFEVLSALRCDVFISPHAGNFEIARKRREQIGGAARNPFLGRPNCADFIGAARAQLNARRGR